MQVDRDTVIRWARESGFDTGRYGAVLDGIVITRGLQKLACLAYEAGVKSQQPEQPDAGHSTRADDEGSTGRRSVASRAKAQVLSDFSHAYKVMGVEPGNIMKALAPTGGERLTPFRPIDYITDDETLEAYVQERIRMAAIGESKT